MIKFVNAKINIGLNIVGRRPDGYHDLETVFYPVGVLNGTPVNPEPFCDILECMAGEGEEGDYAEGVFSYSFAGRTVDCPPGQNLLVRAGTLFAGEMSREGLEVRSARMILTKHLPDGAGLGGGSADASFALTMLNDMHGRPFDDDRLEAMALRLGADCPVFIRNRPAYAEGVGERLEPLALSLKGLWCVIAKPDIYISTREAFAGVVPRRPEEPLRRLIELPVEEWRGRVVNDFEYGLSARYPRLSALKDAMYGAGALYASMSGSGSSVYGLFDDLSKARRVSESIDVQTTCVCCLLT